jgi:tetratricopeptide (TPR) repeat protein
VSKTFYSQLRLDALPPESASELLSALLGDDPGLEPLKRLLVRRGNPFFIEESIRTLVETGALTRERGAYRLTRPIQAIEVPATVQVILAARIDRLPAEDKQLLQMAAVIGKDVPFVLLHAVAELAEDAVHRGLTHLQISEFLYETRLFPDLEYTFKHALTHEVTYGTLLQERRKALHARIVGAIERFYPDRLTEHAERLAHHALRGEVWEKAVTYLRQAGAKAFARSANREAVACFEQALVALQHLPETREALEQAIDLRFDLRSSLHPLGELAAMLTCLRDAERLARALDDPRRLGMVSVYMGHYFWVTGDSSQARQFAHNAQDIAETLGDFPLQIGATFYQGTACFTSGDYRQAKSFFGKAVESLRDDRSRERCGLAGFPAAMARSWLAQSLAEHGAFDEGIVHGQEGVRIAEVIDHPYSLVCASWGPAYVHGVRGNHSQAIAVLERALAVARDWNVIAASPTTTSWLGFMYAMSGRVEEGFSLMQQALMAAESLGLKFDHSLMVVHLGEACVLADLLEDAGVFADRALTLTRERGERGWEAWALRLLGEIAARRDPPDVATAEGYYRQAMTLATELGMHPLVAHCHLGLGKLYRRRGKREQAREHLTTATTMYREMEMRFWLGPAEAELAEVRA